MQLDTTSQHFGISRPVPTTERTKNDSTADKAPAQSRQSNGEQSKQTSAVSGSTVKHAALKHGPSKSRCYSARVTSSKALDAALIGIATRLPRPRELRRAPCSCSRGAASGCLRRFRVEAARPDVAAAAEGAAAGAAVAGTARRTIGTGPGHPGTRQPLTSKVIVSSRAISRDSLLPPKHSACKVGIFTIRGTSPGLGSLLASSCEVLKTMAVVIVPP